MWQALAIGTDLLHAVLMVAWAGGLPLLVWHRWPRVSRGYALYAIVFVVTSQVSRWLLGECFLTTFARSFWVRVLSSAPVSKEWFTVRLARAAFHLTLSHRAIVIVSEAFVIGTAVSALVSLRRLSTRPAFAPPASPSPPEASSPRQVEHAARYERPEPTTCERTWPPSWEKRSPW
jgi:hypothetical protein